MLLAALLSAVFTFHFTIYNSAEQVAEAILQLATERSKVGAVMTVTLSRGINFFRLPGDQRHDNKSKL